MNIEFLSNFRKLSISISDTKGGEATLEIQIVTNCSSDDFERLINEWSTTSGKRTDESLRDYINDNSDNVAYTDGDVKFLMSLPEPTTII